MKEDQEKQQLEGNRKNFPKASKIIDEIRELFGNQLKIVHVKEAGREIGILRTGVTPYLNSDALLDRITSYKNKNRLTKTQNGAMIKLFKELKIRFPVTVAEIRNETGKCTDDQLYKRLK